MQIFDPMRPVVFQHENFASYLRALLEWSKQLSSEYSYGRMAKELGVPSKQTLIMVAGGHRAPTGDLLERIATRYDLQDDELVYATLLVHVDRSRTQFERDHIGKAMAMLRSRQNPGAGVPL